MLRSVGHTLHRIAKPLLNWGPRAPESCHTGVGHCTFSFVSGSSNEEQTRFETLQERGWWWGVYGDFKHCGTDRFELTVLTGSQFAAFC